MNLARVPPYSIDPMHVAAGTVPDDRYWGTNDTPI